MNYCDLDPVVQMMVQEALLEYFYQTFELDRSWLDKIEDAIFDW